MDKNGYDTYRTIVTKEPYRGYHIIKTTSKRHHWSAISLKFLDSIEKTIVEFTFTKSDDTRPTQETDCVFNSKEECKKAIDRMIDKGTIYLTKEEVRKWVYTPNRKCSWSYSYKSLANILNKYKKADERRRFGYLAMLMNANLEKYADLLMRGKYDDYLSLAESDFPIKTDVTITINSLAVEFKLGTETANELKDLINGFLEKKNFKKAKVSKVFTSNEGTLYQ